MSSHRTFGLWRSRWIPGGPHFYAGAHELRISRTRNSAAAAPLSSIIQRQNEKKRRKSEACAPRRIQMNQACLQIESVGG